MTLRHKQHNDLPWKLFIPQRKLKTTVYNDYQLTGECTIFLPRQSYRLPLGANTILQKNYKLQVTSESQENILIISLSIVQQLTVYQ